MASNFSVFISHVTEDEAIAITIKNAIERIFLNSDVFVSGRDLKGGEVWVNEIKLRLHQSSVIITLITDYSLNSNWVLFETGAGFIDNKSIPFCIPPIKLSNLSPPLSLLQARTMDEEGIIKLFQDIAEIAGLRIPKRISGLTEMIDEINKFLELRNKGEKSSKKTKKKLSSQQQKPDDVVVKKILEIDTKIRQYLTSQLLLVDKTTYDIPSQEKLKKLSSDDLRELVEYANLPIDTFFITSFALQRLTIPSSDDPHWKRLNKVKTLDSILEKVNKLIDKSNA